MVEVELYTIVRFIIPDRVPGLIKSKVSCKAEIEKSFAVNACCENPRLSELFRDCLGLVGV